jgi:hypothetical protein
MRMRIAYMSEIAFDLHFPIVRKHSTERPLLAVDSMGQRNPLRPFSFFLLCQRHQRTIVAVRCKHTVITGEVDSWFGHQGGQSGNAMSNDLSQLCEVITRAGPFPISLH